MCTTYCYSSTCGPRNSPQKVMWPFAIKSLEIQALGPPSGLLPTGFPTKTLCMISGSQCGKHDDVQRINHVSSGWLNITA